MKKLIILLLIAFSFIGANAQSITSIRPNGETIQQLDASHVRIGVSATLDQTAYAVVFSVDPIGQTKVLQGKNRNAWAGVAFPSSRGGYLFYELTSILDGIAEGTHTLRVDVYGKSFRDLVDSQEIEFTIKYINP